MSSEYIAAGLQACGYSCFGVKKERCSFFRY